MSMRMTLHKQMIEWLFGIVAQGCKAGQ
ncbi:hypothetical protein ALFP_2107 [Alcaligenes faecalis]|nr:hypothetical protein ALFP_2107 [Alcaligenes faecalis]